MISETVSVQGVSLIMRHHRSGIVRGLPYLGVNETGQPDLVPSHCAPGTFSDCVLLGLGGVTSFKGAIIKSRDAQGLVSALASAMGITIEE